MDKTQIQDVSVMLIANSGDAYGHFNQAIACARKGDFEAADAEITAGRTSIAAAAAWPVVPHGARAVFRNPPAGPERSPA